MTAHVKAKLKARMDFSREVVFNQDYGIYLRVEPRVKVYEPELEQGFQKKIMKSILQDPEVKKALKQSKKR